MKHFDSVVGTNIKYLCDNCKTLTPATNTVLVFTGDGAVLCKKCFVSRHTIDGNVVGSTHFSPHQTEDDAQQCQECEELNCKCQFNVWMNCELPGDRCEECKSTICECQFEIETRHPGEFGESAVAKAKSYSPRTKICCQSEEDI